MSFCVLFNVLTCHFFPSSSVVCRLSSVVCRLSPEFLMFFFPFLYWPRMSLGPSKFFWRRTCLVYLVYLSLAILALKAPDNVVSSSHFFFFFSLQNAVFFWLSLFPQSVACLRCPHLCRCCFACCYIIGCCSCSNKRSNEVWLTCGFAYAEPVSLFIYPLSHLFHSLFPLSPRFSPSFCLKNINIIKSIIYAQ